MSDRPPLPHAPGQVRAELQKRILPLLSALGIKDQPRGDFVAPLNPTRSDKRPGSFVIWIKPEAAGAWNEYATGEKGDVFDLIQYLARLQDWIDAYWWALDFLNLGRGVVRTAAEDRQAEQTRERERKAAEARARRLADNKAKKAFSLWLECPEGILDTPVWTYLTKARGLPLESLPRTPQAMRFKATAEYLDNDTGEITEHPAIYTAMSHWQGGDVRAVHRTYLAPDGMGKAEVGKPKKMLGVADGAAVRLWKGASGLTPERAAKEKVFEPLVITEGIEDGLTAAIARPDMRVWAAGSLSLLGKLGWPDCASAVVLVADNDWDKPQAIAAFERVLAHWKTLSQGRPLKVVRAEQGKDLNDWARAG